MALAGVMKIKKILTLITVVVAGEAIFMPSFSCATALSVTNDGGLECK